MTQLITKEQNTSICVSCPYCSHKYDVTLIEERNNQQVSVADYRKAPQVCEHCGSPMEPGKKAQEFQDRMAEAAANPQTQREPSSLLPSIDNGSPSS